MSPLDEVLQSYSRVQSRALPDDVYDVLLGMLTSGELSPHSALSIDRVAKALNVSQTPVREALARLEHTGLVERVARRGYRVAPPMSKSNMADLVDARLVMEIGAMERAMNHRDEFVVDLEAAMLRHEAAARSLNTGEGDLDKEAVREYFVGDWSFHQAILDHCHNPYLARSVNALSFSVHRMRQTLGLGSSDAPFAVEEHQRILASVKSNDRDGAIQALADHLQEVARRSVE